jgi:hypothetical protein
VSGEEKEVGGTSPVALPHTPPASSGEDEPATTTAAAAAAASTTTTTAAAVVFSSEEGAAEGAKSRGEEGFAGPAGEPTEGLNGQGSESDGEEDADWAHMMTDSIATANGANDARYEPQVRVAFNDSVNN